MNILSINNLSKEYGFLKALDNVSFNIPEGSIYGILGPNGSGKTTLLSILLNIVLPNSGSFQFDTNEEMKDYRKNVGTLLETPNFYHYLTAEQNLRIVAAIRGKGEDRIEEVLKTVDLWKKRHLKFKGFSLGMRQRLAIASALLSDPKLLILDEPTNGLDPQGIHEIRELIKSIHRSGKTIIMASHLLDEVEKTCTHVAVLQQGKLITEGTVGSIVSEDQILEINATDINRLSEILSQLEGVRSIENFPQFVKVHIDQSVLSAEKINQYCFNHGIVLNHLRTTKQSLEAKFLALTQN
ncbi:ABC transporter ATP-binding protein [Gynurincola endophyticus]|uniref:ABC transporter ATP-binding protein n=1 Tax=Gynurincola endophyticus TaxID=2479004 RepID=UPI000F8DA04F|nr:ABC transporter ATP-binding protein [Gynurincola endophyticus]